MPCVTDGPTWMPGDTPPLSDRELKKLLKADLNFLEKGIKKALKYVPLEEKNHILEKKLCELCEYISIEKLEDIKLLDWYKDHLAEDCMELQQQAYTRGADWEKENAKRIVRKILKIGGKFNITGENIGGGAVTLSFGENVLYERQNIFNIFVPSITLKEIKKYTF